MTTDCDLLVIGAGAAGLFAAIHAGRAARDLGLPLSIVALDSARRLGAKILVAGGGRCNVTHWRVDDRDFAGSTPAAIRKVLRRYGVEEVTRFFSAAGVELKREETGKLFPVSDSSRTVLDALLAAARQANVRLVHPARVTALAADDPSANTTRDRSFRVTTEAGAWKARRVILATGGRSLPKSGSDGSGHRLAKSLGHDVSQPVVPALVPLLLPDGHFIRVLSGLTLPTELTLCGASGKRLVTTSGSTLCTHLGLSGPAVLDISRHWLVARHHDPTVGLVINWLPGTSSESLDAVLRDSHGRGPLVVLRERLPERLARALCLHADCPPTGDISREARRRLSAAACRMPLPVYGDRGFAVAEATAGGVPLAEVRLETMESRICPGLHLAGEVLDVDGRIGGFNFQWAWSSGFVAGTEAVTAFLACVPATDVSPPMSPARS